jgi:hypothetical protein
MMLLGRLFAVAEKDLGAAGPQTAKSVRLLEIKSNLTFQ